MKRIIKVKAFLLALLFVFSAVLVGCNNSQQTTSQANTNDSTSKSSDTTKAATPGKMVEISAMVFDRGNVPEGQGTVTDNRWTKWINEEMAKENIHVTFIPVPRSDEATKIPVMMASGSAADIMILYNQAQVAKFFDDGGTLDMAPYLKEYGQEFVNYVTQECIDIGTNEKGNIYGVPARRSTTAQRNLFIRKDWLDILGMDIPNTPDELYEVLSAFKTKDPGKMGSDKVIAAAFNGDDMLLHAFVQKKDDKDSLINGITHSTGIFYTDQENSLKWFEYRNKLYNEGLLDKEYFTAKDFGQATKEQAVKGLLGFWTIDVNGNVDNLRGAILQNLKQNIPTAELISMEPLKNIYDGNRYNPRYSIAGAFIFFPKTNKHPVESVKYLDFLAGNGGFTVFHGIEGEHFKFVDGVPVVIDPEHNAKTKDYTRHDLFLVGNQGYYKTEEDFFAATAKELPGWENYVLDNYKNATAGYRMPTSTYNSPTQISETANINKVYDDYEVQLTTAAPGKVPEIFAKFISELEKYKIKEILAERKAYFDETMK